MSETETRSERIAEDLLPILPVRNLVVFPGSVTHVSVGRPLSVAAAEIGANQGRRIGIVLQRDPNADTPGQDDLYDIGTTVTVVRLVTAPNGTHHLICQGEERFKIENLAVEHPYLAARVQVIDDDSSRAPEILARMKVLKERTLQFLKLVPEAPPELAVTLAAIEDPGAAADLAASFLDMKPEEKQALLEVIDLEARLDEVLAALDRELKVLELSHELGAKSKSRLEERQREVLLREQLKTIQEELGHLEGDSEVDSLEAAITKAGMPEEVEEEARKELKRLSAMPEASTEYSMVHTYLDWLISLPWQVEEVPEVDIAKARQSLDEDHYGLAKVKRRILEYIAVRKLNKEGHTPILCFVGPPGVGKTSLGQSIAKALGLEFVRASLGGVHDEAEIRGHRRTYVGALPGTIVQNLKKAGARNPVFMLDEMDKLGSGLHGDPASALLEVLDPAQNDTFQDNYLGVPFDLSKVFFIGTANVLDDIPGPLRDRMEVIELPGYTLDEKLEIAERYLVQRQLVANGLTKEQVTVSRTALAEVVDGYTREAGVRQLEREISSLLRNAAVRIAEEDGVHIDIGAEDVHATLGARKFEREVQARTSRTGVATGLAWTPVGGDILFVESTAIPGTGQLTLTGQLGEVMKESAQAAISLAKLRLENYNLDRTWLFENDFHVHVPAGAIPKDGPSAGVAMFVALVSLISGRKVRSDVAMTGEISLRGLVLPVGGIKEKSLAALRAGINTVLLPSRNKKDLEDIPESAREQLNFVWLETVEDALAAAFEPEHSSQAA